MSHDILTCFSFDRLPDKFPDGVRVLIADPMLSTGNAGLVSP
jgi:uracil phosphoribosyltransferase